MSNTPEGIKIDIDAEWASYERLPREWRDFLKYFPFDIGAGECLFYYNAGHSLDRLKRDVLYWAVKEKGLRDHNV